MNLLFRLFGEQIEAIEAQIAVNQQIINEAAAQKQAVMKKYL